MLRWLLPPIAALGLVRAAEPDHLQGWIDELSATYRGLDGYIATYRSEGENKQLVATVATHFDSGLGSVSVEMLKDGNPAVARWWVTPDQVIYIDPPGPEKLRIRSIETELRFLVSFTEISSDPTIPKLPFVLSANPVFLLNSDSIEGGIAAANLIHPAWHQAVAGATVLSSDAGQVTFRTAAHGDLTISRQSGILTHQTFPGHPDGERVLELTELRLTDDPQTVAALSSDWSTLGAVDAGAGIISAPNRLEIFQSIITAIETGSADLGKLETKLEADRAGMRTFAASSIITGPGSISSRLQPILERHQEPIRAKMKEYWLKTAPDAREDDPLAFEAFLARPEMRAQARDGFVKGIMKVWGKDEEAGHRILSDFFGRDPKAVLKSEKPVGTTAKDMIEAALVRAWFEALIERRLAADWAEREGLD